MTIDDNTFIIPDGPIFRAMRGDSKARDIADTDPRTECWYHNKEGKYLTYSLGFAAGGGLTASHGSLSPMANFALTDFDLLTYCAICTLWVAWRGGCRWCRFTAEDLYAASPWELTEDWPSAVWEREVSNALAKLSCARISAENPWRSGRPLQENILYARVRLGGGEAAGAKSGGNGCLVPDSSITVLDEPFFLNETRASGRMKAVPMDKARELMRDGIPDDPFGVLLGAAETVNCG